MSTPDMTPIDTSTDRNIDTTDRGNLFGNITIGDSGIGSIATGIRSIATGDLDNMGAMGGFDEEEHHYGLSSDSVARVGGGRRVSFGPSARLSFSSIKGDMECYYDQTDSNIANDEYLIDSSSDSYRQQPLKVQRMGTPTSPINDSHHHPTNTVSPINDVSDSGHHHHDHPTNTVSPIPMTTNTPRFHTTNDKNMSKKLRSNEVNDLFEDEFETSSDQLESLLISSNKGLKIQKESDNDNNNNNNNNNNIFEVDDISTKMKIAEIKNQKEISGKVNNNEDNNQNNNQNNNINCEILISGLLSVFSRAYQLLCMFKCKECVNLLHRLPRSHFSSGLVQHLLGEI
jgi:hypothetical protein